MTPEVAFKAADILEYGGKRLEMVLKSYKEPFRRTMDGSIPLYCQVEIHDPENRGMRWGHVNFADPIYEDYQAAIIFNNIRKNPEAVKD